MVIDAQIGGEGGGIVAAVLAGDRRRQGDAHDILRAQRLGGQCGHDGGIDAAGEPDEGAGEAAFVGVVADAQHQRALGGGIALEVEIFREARCGGIEIDDAMLRRKAGESGDEAALRMGDQAATVKNQLIIAADHIAVDGGAGAALGGHLDQGLAGFVFALVPGAGREVDQEINGLAGQFRHRILAVAAAGGDGTVIPDVLADGDADAQTPPLHDCGTGSRFKVALLIEDIVVGQKGLAADVLHPAIRAPGCGIVERAARRIGRTRLDETDQRRNGTRGRRYLPERGLGIGCETAFKQKIPGRVAADGQLRKDHQLGPVFDKAAVGIENKCAVPGEVADGGVDLREADFHERIETTV